MTDWNERPLGISCSISFVTVGLDLALSDVYLRSRRVNLDYGFICAWIGFDIDGWEVSSVDIQPGKVCRQALTADGKTVCSRRKSVNTVKAMRICRCPDRLDECGARRLDDGSGDDRAAEVSDSALNGTGGFLCDGDGGERRER